MKTRITARLLPMMTIRDHPANTPQNSIALYKFFSKRQRTSHLQLCRSRRLSIVIGFARVIRLPSQCSVLDTLMKQSKPSLPVSWHNREFASTSLRKTFSGSTLEALTAIFLSNSWTMLKSQYPPQINKVGLLSLCRALTLHLPLIAIVLNVRLGELVLLLSSLFKSVQKKCSL